MGDDMRSSEIEGDVGCLNEMGFIGNLSKEKITVVAVTTCHVRLIHRDVCNQILDNFGEKLDSLESGLVISAVLATKRAIRDAQWQARHAPPKEEKVERRTDYLLEGDPIFKRAQCREGFLQFLEDNLEDRIFFHGQVINDVKDPNAQMLYILRCGEVELKRPDGTPSRIEDKQGYVFGETSLLGNRKKYTFVASGCCWVKVLHPAVLQKAFDNYDIERRSLLSATFAAATEISQKKMSIASYQREKTKATLALLRVLQRSSKFSNLPTEFLRRLSEVSVEHIYMPGDAIIQQGERSDSMFMIINGTASVHAESHGRTVQVGQMSVGDVIGELAMLDVAKTRSATIIAETICTLWEVTHEAGVPIITGYPEAMKYFKETIAEHLERTVPTRLLSMPMFRGFDRKVCMLLGLYCERGIYFQDDVIVKEGMPGDKLHVINLGICLVQKSGEIIRTYQPGQTFGTTVMLGTHKVYFATLIALRTAHIVSITRTTYQHALELYQSHSLGKQLKDKEEKAEAEHRRSLMRTLAKKQIQRRNKNIYRSGVGAMIDLGAGGLQILFTAWKDVIRDDMIKRTERRKERKKREESINGWLIKRRDAIGRARESRALRELRTDDSYSLLPSTCQQSHDDVGIDAAAERSDALKDLQQRWPLTKPSPFYKLRVWDVLEDVVKESPVALPLLPIFRVNAETNTVGDSDEAEVIVSNIAPASHRSVPATPRSLPAIPTPRGP